MPKALILTALTLLTLIACHNSPPGRSDISPLPWTMALSTTPDPPVSGKVILFRLTLWDQTGRPVTGAHVEAALDMPLMDMGPNHVILTDKGIGAYEATATFTMTGPWNVVVGAQAQNQSIRKTFPIAVRE
jgi:nitrogen fixation protein FixH